MKSLVADAGFLVALWRREDQHHKWAVAAARANPPPWVTCEATFSEAEHLLGPMGRASLRTACQRGALRIRAVLAEELQAVLELLEKYHDLPMSAADACVVRMTKSYPSRWY